ncbi:hypothetical protein SAMN02745146_2253 [Hymenobacter daecheongensis DSM 21074]|uniref:Exostosin family protein n=1 Tax=Hymenobacter daecheongensis DSM 21074 TaxID=1121955 RepID=A0A1M6GGL9_9BACT|nr:glycosyltransferase [Hymenobacter daecheongensis]SHJ09048.1 hypothetical protein SAMN02745146_2253 [Hymenobacter daecheongensis DSM 21074]
MKIKGIEYDNVVANFAQETWEDDSNFEQEYMGNIIANLHTLLGAEAKDYIILIYSHLWIAKDNRYDFIAQHGDTKKIVVLYLSDEDPSSPLPDELMSKKVFAVFKTSLVKDGPYPNLYKFPLGYAASTKHRPVTEINTRKTNVYFSGALHNTRLPLFKNFTFFRALPQWYWIRVFHQFKKYVPHNYNGHYPDSHIQFNKGGFRSGMTPDKYTELLYNSKIVLCPTGILSQETLRHYEAMRAGCIVISDPLPDTFYYTGSPMIIMHDWSKLDALVKDLLGNPQRMSEIQQKTLAWWKDVCSEEAVAQYMLDTLRRQPKPRAAATAQ